MVTKLFNLKEEININISTSLNAKEENLEKINQNVVNTSIENTIFEKIKETFIKENVNMNTSINKKYFSCKNAKYTFMIEKTILAPNASILISFSNFEEKYLNQLESYIFTNKEDINVEKLIVLCYLFSFINRNMIPICIKSNQYKKLLPKIIYTLNQFYNKNYSIIKSIYIMFNSLKDTKKEAGENNV